MYLCSLCDKSFSSKRTLRGHQESTHRKSASFSYHVCSKRFHSKDVLKENLKMHKPTVAVAPPSAEPEKPVNDLHNQIDSYNKEIDSSYCLQGSNWWRTLFFGKTDIYFIRIILSDIFFVHLRVYGEHFSTKLIDEEAQRRIRVVLSFYCCKMKNETLASLLRLQWTPVSRQP